MVCFLSISYLITRDNACAGTIDRVAFEVSKSGAMLKEVRRQLPHTLNIFVSHRYVLGPVTPEGTPDRKYL